MDLRVETTRGGVVESVHRVSLAAVDQSGRLVASAGDPELVTFWRSAAKPFQALPVLIEGAAERFGFDQRELALSASSHSSEPAHLQVVDGMLKKVGSNETALACGPHPPLSPRVAEEVLRRGITLTPRWSNCSGKHTAMLALARHRDWPLAGYERAGHPLQLRVLAEVSRWTDVPAKQIQLGVDGCTAVSFGLPLRAMALAYARFGDTTDPAGRWLRDAMQAHPLLIAGEGRPCTDLMTAYPGRLVVKVGAGGIYGVALVGMGIGVALKLEDGDMSASPVALIAALRALVSRLRLPLDLDELPPAVQRHAEPAIVNTRGTVTGSVRAVGTLRFSAE